MNAAGHPVHAMMPGIPGMQGHVRGPMAGQVCLVGMCVRWVTCGKLNPSVIPMRQASRRMRVMETDPA